MEHNKCAVRSSREMNNIMLKNSSNIVKYVNEILFQERFRVPKTM